MDPLSQAVVGANLSQCFAKKENFKIAGIAGILGGVLPDIDVLIKSKVDPLLSLEYHRHFTHSLLMVPVLALPVAGLLWLIYKKKITFKEIYFYAFLGVLTHGLLDACTSYGTQLLWPFSNLRVAWNNIAIIDPLFTLPGLLGIFLADKKRSTSLARFTLGYMLFYLLLGVYQREAATQTAQQLASSRGHNYTRIEAKPSIGSLILWRTLYETPEGIFYVDAVNNIPFRKHKTYPGGFVDKWTLNKLPTQLEVDSILKHDLERFSWFSDDYLYVSNENPLVLGDLRYSTIPNSLEPLWGISFNPQKTNEHVELQYFRVINDDLKKLYFSMLRGD